MSQPAARAAASPSPITPEVVAAHGLKPEEYQKILAILEREPNLVELGMFAAMWSEHCSYKSTRIHLKKLPTEAPWVICGPGENAGVIDIGDGQAAIFKMESHNHPSFIEPYQGAATGVGGILRDVFTMGARPIANLNALRFGDPEHPRTKLLVSGVVAGVGGYGNCVGVPTVGGECTFHPSYNGNNLVNAMTVGLADAERIFYSAAAGVGNPVVYVGSKTGRDGIKGAVMASAEFDDQSASKRPTVQVGDPFTEKLLIEACLELMATDTIAAIQDMGAAGLTCACFEMPGKGGTGIEVELSHVPTREPGMTPYEIMLSESQERMLVVLKPGCEEIAATIFRKWELDFAVIGRITDTGRVVLKMNGRAVADLPVDPLSEEAPVYDRPWVESPARTAVDAASVPDMAPLEALQTLMGSPNLASRRWIWEQYDHRVMNDTILAPGGDAALVRVHGTQKALALSSDCTPRYVFADPREGGKQAVAETYRNISAVGAMPLAITNCLNFGNPEKPEIMGQLVLSLEGMGEACRALDYPIISGNVSLYNETSGQAILPTPTIGGVGLLTDASLHTTAAFKQAGDAVYLIGETQGHLGASLYLQVIAGREEGPPPPVDLATEKRHAAFVREQIAAGRFTACHDVSDGGLLVALAEMALGGGLGCAVNPLPVGEGRVRESPAHGVPLTPALSHGERELPPPGSLRAPAPPQGGGNRPLQASAFWFGEDQARYLCTVKASDAAALEVAARAASIPLQRIATVTESPALVIGEASLPLETLRTAHEGWFPGMMG